MKVIDMNFGITFADHVFIIGAHRNENGSFTWPNGTSEEFSQYTFWDRDQPNNYGGKKDFTNDCIEQCVAYIAENLNTHKWHDVPCHSKYRYICQYINTLEHCSSNVTNTSCFQGKFYNVSNFRYSYKEATERCIKTGGTLLNVKNIEIQNFTMELIRRKDIPRLDPYVEHFFKWPAFWSPFLQIFAVHVQLTIVVGLCMDGGKSLTSKFLRTKMMQFLGRISLSLYLLQWSLMGFVLLAINGPQYFNPNEDIIWDFTDSIFL
jgi:hypothetical protein